MNTHVTKAVRRIGLVLIPLCVVVLMLVSCDEPTPYTHEEPQPPSKPSLPDLVLTDIVLKPKPAGYGYKDDVIINTVVRNNGANATQGFNVWCSFQCKDPSTNSPTYFSGMELPNGLGSGKQATLGGDALLDLSGCSFKGSRKFTCYVDQENYVNESDETNNQLEEILLTGR